MRGVLRCAWAVVAMGIVVVGLATLQAQTSSSAFSLDARWITGYRSLCDVEPKHSPKSATIPPGGKWTVRGCSDLDKQDAVPLALTVTNSGSTVRQLAIPLLSEVTIGTGASSAAAAALYIPWGGASGFATEVVGHLTVDLAPKSSVDFVYLLPKRAAGATIYVKGHGAVKPARD